ncbi:interleukin-like EMT inducer domain-containing protein [Teredinibacter haidensis]|uniref:interleukin-like EMT inducer domain-containing protein n=1 Tax=Teredinibacter haidensis TaxID=2731755 RepID=UPI00094919AC|nr:interleukin-like EMT inducer domain-containing protein [Teredinibacter haidensis]
MGTSRSLLFQRKAKGFSLIHALVFTVVVLAFSLIAIAYNRFAPSSDTGVIFTAEGGVFESHSYLDHTLKFSRKVFNGSQVKVKIGRVIFNQHVRLNLTGAKEYSLSFFNNKDFIASTKFSVDKRGFRVTEFGYLIEVPARASEEGFDEVVVTPHFEFEMKVSFDDTSRVNVDRGTKSVTIPEFLKSLPSTHYVILAIKDEGTRKLSESSKNALAKMGSNIKSIRYRGSWAAVWKNGKPLAEMIEAHDNVAEIRGQDVLPLAAQLSEQGLDLVVRSAGYEAGNFAQISVGGKDHSRNRRGVNIVVLDERFNLVNSLTADTFSRDRMDAHQSLSLYANRYPELTLGSVLAEIPDDFIVLLTSKGNYLKGLAPKSLEYFDSVNSKFSQRVNGQSYIGILRNRHVLNEKLGDGAQAMSLFESAALKDLVIKSGAQVSLVSSADNKGMSGIYIDGENISENSPGINLVVLSPKFEVISRYGFDAVDGDLHRNITVLQKQPMRTLEYVSAEDESDTLEKLRFSVKPEHYQTLVSLRDEALNRESIKNASKQEVPAKIDFQGKTYKAGIRFKGDWMDHISKERWSFRVNLKGDNTIMGMKRFSIQSPETRAYMYEWVVHEVFRHEGGITPRYSFLPVDINNKRFGVYALEEHFGKRMVEYHGRKEGPILKFDESRIFESVDAIEAVLPEGITFENKMSTLQKANIQVFQREKTLSAENLRENYRRGYALLDGFRNKLLVASDVFDVESYAKLVAISDLFQTWHSVRWHNMRYYYNPIIDRLEPILFDADAPDKSYESLHYFNRHRDEVNEYLFSDAEFAEAYFGFMEKFSKRDYLSDFRRTFKDEIKEKEKILSTNGGNYKMEWSLFERRQELIRNTLFGGDPLAGVVNYVGGNGLLVKLQNDFDVPYEIGALHIGSNRYATSGLGNIVEAKQKDAAYHFSVSLPESEIRASALMLDYRVPGTTTWRQVQIFPFGDPFLEVGKNGFIRDRSNIDDFPFVRESGDNVIEVIAGEWRVGRDLLIPAGKRVLVPAGTTLDFVNSAKVISFSPMSVMGSDKHPVTFQSSDNSSQGIIVIQANKPSNRNNRSILDHVIFSGLSNPNDDGWMVPGAVTFYQSDVVITNSVFSNNNSEDALNIVSSDYILSGVTFEGAFSDAFDSDFSTGEVNSCRFINSGNDAIDFSGSVVSISNVKITTAGDKGVSAGEASSLTLTDIVIDGAEIGIASKDGSKVFGSDVNVMSAVIGLAAYQKKPEYTKAYINLSDSSLGSKISLPFVYDDGSDIYFNKTLLRMKEKKKNLLIKKIAGV